MSDFRYALKIYNLFNPKERKRFYISLFLIFIGMIFEALGISIIFPILNSILDINFFEKYNFTGINQEYFLSLSIILVCALYFLRLIFLVFLSYYQNRFVSFFCHRVSKDLLSNYIKKEYKFFLTNNSSDLVKNILVETTHFMTYFTAFMVLLTEITFVIAILSVMIFIEPPGTIIVTLFFGLSGYLVYSITKKKLVFWGMERQSIDNNISRVVHEGFGAIKEIKVNRIENIILQDFNTNINKKADIHFKHIFVSQLPKNLFEFIAIIGLLVFGGILYIQDYDMNMILSKSGLFIGASFRLITSLNKVVSNIQQMKYYDSAVKTILNEYTPAKQNQTIIKNQALFDFNSHIQFKNVTFHHSKNEPILKNLNFKIKKGEIIGIVGESGSGKSTVLDLILGLLEPNKGEIRIDNKILTTKNIRSWTLNLSYVPQFIYLLDDKIIKNIVLNDVNSKIDHDRLTNAMYQAQIQDFLNKKKNHLNTKVGEKGNNLSGGQLQRIGISRALYKNSPILILDEFTSNIDLETEIKIMDRITDSKKDKTIILTSHRKETLNYCDRVFIISNGTLTEKNG